MIQGDFLCTKSSKPVGFSGSQFSLGVEPLHDATGQLAFGTEPVQQEVAVSSQHAGHSLHRLDPGSQGGAAPTIEKAPGPVGRSIAPEELEVFLEQTGTNRFQVVPQQIGQPAALFFGEPLGAFEQQQRLWVNTGSSPWALSSRASWARTSSMAWLRCAQM